MLNSQLIRSARSLREGADILNNQADALVVHVAVGQLSNNMRAFRDLLIKKSIGYRQQPNARANEPKRLERLLHDREGLDLRDCVPVSFSAYRPMIEGHQMLHVPGGIIGVNKDGQTLSFDVEGYDHVKHLAIQGNERGRTIPPKLHKDFGAVTINFYLEGDKKLKYKIGDSLISERTSGPSITMHRGYEHPLVKELGNDNLAAAHVGQIYAPGEQRASMHITLSDEQQLEMAQHPYPQEPWLD